MEQVLKDTQKNIKGQESVKSIGNKPGDFINYGPDDSKRKIIGDEGQQSMNSSKVESGHSGQMPKMRLLDRSQLMDMMLFPQNCIQMVIVPSNKEGTGFLNHCYDKQYLKGFITEKEFNAIILICSRIAARAYS